MFCDEKGIRHEFTVAYSPQMNGIAKRLNCTFLERVRILLFDSLLLTTFWGKGLQYTFFTLNRLPRKAIDFKIPNELWYEKPIDYSFLNVFGCKVHVLIYKDFRTKIYPYLKQGTFVGYGDSNMGYRVFDKDTNKLIRSRSVVFLENESCIR